MVSQANHIANLALYFCYIHKMLQNEKTSCYYNVGMFKHYSKMVTPTASHAN